MGGGQRTKETNLKEICFGGVKSGELEFSVPSPWRQIHLVKPNLCVYTHEHINRHKEQTARMKQIGGGGGVEGWGGMMGRVDRDLV